MSWDVLLMRFPDDAASTDDLPEDCVPSPIGPATEVLDRIRAAFPETDLSDPARGILQDEDEGWSMELGIGSHDPVEDIMLYIQGPGDAVPAALRLARLLDCRALECADGEFLSEEGARAPGECSARSRPERSGAAEAAPPRDGAGRAGGSPAVVCGR